MEFLFNTTSLTDVGCTARCVKKSALQAMSPFFTGNGNELTGSARQRFIPNRGFKRLDQLGVLVHNGLEDSLAHVMNKRQRSTVGILDPFQKRVALVGSNS